MTRVSIVTPSFNQSAYLERTMRSVLGQDYPDVEYIVIDGASNDGSVDIIKKYSPRLMYWCSEKDAGQADAINKGMRHAKGEIVAWLNSDDYYLSGAIKSAVAAFESNPQAVMVYGDMLAVDQTGQTVNHLCYRQLTLEDLLCFQIIGQPAVFMRRTVFEKAGGLDVSFHYMLDHQLWLKIAAQGPMVHVSQIWSAARFHPGAKNRAQAPGFGREAFRILDWVDTQSSLAPILQHVQRRAHASVYRVNARYLLDDGQSWNALKAWIRAMIIHPPTALARLNLLGSALLDLLGLSRVREAVLRRRQRQYKSNDKVRMAKKS
jgi:glycosyltransferase involved in cell wall biosynthesis